MLTLGRRVGNAVRLAEVVQVLVKHGFADLVRRAGLHEGLPAKLLRGIHLVGAPVGEPATAGQRLRAVLTELGPTFIKFGQVLSTRPDIIGGALSRDLTELQDRVAPEPFDIMEPVLRKDLGAGIGDLFAEFNTEPVACASLSQVYRARTRDGHDVAVKIQRPGIAGVIDSDLRLMRSIAEWVAYHVGEADWIDPVGVVDEFARSIERELDFLVEARVIDRFRANFEEVDEVFVPHTWPELCAGRVLTMDWVDGVRVDAFDAYPSRNCDLEVVARCGAELICRQVFEHHLFHADPHPGNIFILRDNRLAFLDYGMVGHIEPGDVAALAELLRAVFDQNAEGCMEPLRLLTLGEPDDTQGLEHDIANFIAFEGQVIVSGGKVGEGIEKMVAILRRNKIQLAPRFSLLLRALAIIEAVGHQLDPRMDMAPIIRPHVERLLATRYSPLRIAAEARDGMAAFLRLGRQLPGDIEQLMRMLRRGRLKFQVNHEGLDRAAGVADRASNRLTVGVITGALIIGSSWLVTGPATQTLGLIGYSVAGILGLLVVFSILRSRNI